MTTMTTAGPRPRAAGLDPRALLINLILCLALIGQFLLGMVTNLFVTIPPQHPGVDAHEYFTGVARVIGWAIPHGTGWLTAHVLLGLVLVVAGLADLATIRRVRSGAYTAAVIVGALAIIGAGFNGASFLIYDHDLSSMLMAGLWALALLCYLLCLLARRAVSVAEVPAAGAWAPPRPDGERAD